jgi:hypothetical protein
MVYENGQAFSAQAALADGQDVAQSGWAAAPWAANVENRRDSFFDWQCGQTGFSPAERISSSNCFWQDSHSYS